MAAHDLVIRGGTVVDGTGAPARTADVAITDGLITEVGRVEGTYACGNGASGEITFFDLRVEPGGISGRYTGRGSGCDFNGNLGLARRK